MEYILNLPVEQPSNPNDNEIDCGKLSIEDQKAKVWAILQDILKKQS